MATKLRNIKLLIEYNGAELYGWQRQDKLPTVQGFIEEALKKVLGEVPSMIVAGRTDAGVHAIGQVANFRTKSDIADWKFAPALNHHLPSQISIHKAKEVPAAFNARNDSHSKKYRYRIYEGPQKSALEYQRAWEWRSRIDETLIRNAASHLIGEHDFESFRNTECDADHAVREMFEILVETSLRPPLGRYIDITFHANAYCRHMCRILAGTLMEVGLGKRAPDSMQHIIDARIRTAAGQTAPAFGLTLMEVIYPRGPEVNVDTGKI